MKWWMLELSILCHCVQHLWKLTSVGISGTLRTKENHFLSRNVFWKKRCGVSQKWWMLELSNLSHCFQLQRKLTSRDFWSSKNEKKPLSKQKCVLKKCCRDITEMVNVRDFNSYAIVFNNPENLLVRDFWSSRKKRKSPSKQKYVLRKCPGVPQKWWMLEVYTF